MKKSLSVFLLAIVLMGCVPSASQSLQTTPTITATLVPAVPATLTPTATSIAVSASPAPVTPTPQCDDPELTTEQCANFGSHEYAYVATATSGTCAGSINSGIVLIVFTPISDTSLNVEWSFEAAAYTVIWNEVGAGTYSFEYSWNTSADDYGTASGSATLTTDGFTITKEVIYQGISPDICSWSEKYVLQ